MVKNLSTETFPSFENFEIDIFKVTKVVNNIDAKNELPDINHFTFHPGGKKIKQTVEDLFANLGKNINENTRSVLQIWKY